MYQFGDVVLLEYPFTDLIGVKMRPAIVLKDTDDGDFILARGRGRVCWGGIGGGMARRSRARGKGPGFQFLKDFFQGAKVPDTGEARQGHLQAGFRERRSQNFLERVRNRLVSRLDRFRREVFYRLFIGGAFVVGDFGNGGLGP